MTHDSSPLDAFLFQQIKGLSGRKLDFGCGNGRFLRFCQERDLVIDGTDAFEYHYSNWDQGRDRITRIVEDVAPYPDGAFSQVVSNMVFEHIPSNKVDVVAAEISRLLAPGGIGIFIFPTRRTVVEGHVGVPFAHWVDFSPLFLGKYLSTSYRVGIGYWRSDQKRGGRATVPREAWVSRFVAELSETVHYSPLSKWSSAFTSAGCEVRNESYRLAEFATAGGASAHLVHKASRNFVTRRVLNLMVEFRLGVVMEITKLKVR